MIAIIPLKEIHKLGYLKICLSDKEVVSNFPFLCWINCPQHV